MCLIAWLDCTEKSTIGVPPSVADGSGLTAVAKRFEIVLHRQGISHVFPTGSLGLDHTLQDPVGWVSPHTTSRAVHLSHGLRTLRQGLIRDVQCADLHLKYKAHLLPTQALFCATLPVGMNRPAGSIFHHTAGQSHRHAPISFQVTTTRPSLPGQG
jgi:hypothetical protein